MHGNPLNIYWIHFRVIISKQTQIFIWQQCVEIGKWHKTRLLIHCFQRRFIYIFICNEQFIDHLQVWLRLNLICRYDIIKLDKNIFWPMLFFKPFLSRKPTQDEYDTCTKFKLINHLKKTGDQTHTQHVSSVSRSLLTA